MTVPIDVLPFDPETYEPPHPAHELMAAKFASLAAGPTSASALGACRSLLAHLFNETEERTTSKQLQALGALVADLLERDPGDEGGWLYRSMDPKSFTGGAIGYRPFAKVYAAMTNAMVEDLAGNRVWGSSAITNNKKRAMWQRATRFRATPGLRQWFADQGITRSEWADHFKRDLSQPIAAKGTCSVVLRTGKPPRHFKVSRGYPVPIDMSAPSVAAMVARVDRINEYFSKADVSPYGPVVLRRIFAQGDDTGHGWQQGGRLYAVGPTPYQTAKREQRALITINGEATCELDIRASHLTILAGLGHVPRFEGDPYAIEDLPRPVVKQWVNMTLSHGKRHTRWPSATVSTLMKDHGINVKADYPLERTGDTILRHLPILKDDGSAAVAVGWGELQFRESEVVLAAMEVLAFEHDVPALPVHDSLIVPRSARDITQEALSQVFRGAFGVEANIT